MNSISYGDAIMDKITDKELNLRAISDIVLDKRLHVVTNIMKVIWYDCL